MDKWKTESLQMNLSFFMLDFRSVRRKVCGKYIFSKIITSTFYHLMRNNNNLLSRDLEKVLASNSLYWPYYSKFFWSMADIHGMWLLLKYLSEKMVLSEVIQLHSTLANFLQKKQSFLPHNGVEKFSTLWFLWLEQNQPLLI